MTTSNAIRPKDSETTTSPDPKVQEIVRSIQQAAGPQAAVTIFGSQARGDHRPDSDLDLLVDLQPDPSDPAARLNQWLVFLYQSPDLIDSLEAKYDLTIDNVLVESRRSLTEFWVVPMQDPSGYAMVNTDRPCNHPEQTYCGDCQVCSQHQELGVWPAINGQITACQDCWNAVATVSDQLTQATKCPNQPASEQQEPPGRAHVQNCVECYNRQPTFEELLKLAAQHRNLAGPRGLLGATSPFWIRFNL